MRDHVIAFLLVFLSAVFAAPWDRSGCALRIIYAGISIMHFGASFYYCQPIDSAFISLEIANEYSDACLF